MKEEERPLKVCFALEYEAEAFRKSLSERPFIEKDVDVIVTGIGADAARGALEGRIEADETELCISAGFAGALTEDFPVGEVVVDAERSDPGILKLMQEDYALPPRKARFTTSSAPVSGAERASLAASRGAEIVEMEGEAIASLCRERKIPFVGLRVVSDSPAEEFPAPPEVMARAATDRLHFSLWLARHPLAASQVARFSRSTRRNRQLLSNYLLKLTLLWRAAQAR